MKWVIVEIYHHKDYTQTTAWEDHGNGEYTAWGYSIYGAIGTRGKPKPEAKIKIREPKNTKKDRRIISEVEELIKRGVERSKAWAEIYHK